MGKIYIIPMIENKEESYCLAEEWGASFEYNDFYFPDVLDNKEKFKKIIKEYQEMGRDKSEDTIHGAFFDVTIHSSDKKIREISRKRVRQSMEAADELGVKAVIFHTNYIPGFELKSYKEKWIEDNAKFWEEMLTCYPKRNIYIENMFDQRPELLVQLAREMKNERFGICFDYAHGAVSSTPLEEWVRELSLYVKHIHINDNDCKQDLHLPVGMGSIDWEVYNNQMKLYHIDSTVLIEVKGIGKQRDSLMYMKQKGIYPFKNRN